MSAFLLVRKELVAKSHFLLSFFPSFFFLYVIAKALVEQFEDKDAPASERMIYFYSLLFPSRWELQVNTPSISHIRTTNKLITPSDNQQRELGDRFASFGAYRSSLEIYERWELWDSATTCYMSMDKKKQAEELVRKQQEIKSTPKLWCLLGDITGEIKHYVTAWDLSQHTFARARRSLGSYHFKRKEVPTLFFFFLFFFLKKFCFFLLIVCRSCRLL